MDNFMDKLAKRFNAGELIQANGEAEARENQRLREQMNEYDKVIQEIRRLNLKTIEVSEQVSQMAACSIEQIESYQAPVTEDDFREDYTDEFISLSRKVDEAATEMRQEVKDATYRLEAAFSQAESSISEMQTYINQMSAGISRLELGNDTNQKAVESAIRNLEQILEEKSKDDGKEQESAKQIKEMIVNVRLYLDEVQKHVEDYMHKESVKVYRNVQAAVNEQLSLKARDMNDHMDQIEKGLAKNKGTKALVVLAVLLSGASLVLQVLQMFGIL